MSTLRTILLTACTLLLLALAIAVSPLRQPVGEAANNLPVVVSNTNANPVPVTLGASPTNPLPVSQAPATPGEISIVAAGQKGTGVACGSAAVPSSKRFVIQGITSHIGVPTGLQIDSAILRVTSRDLTSPGATSTQNVSLMPVLQGSVTSEDDWVATQQFTAYAEPGSSLQLCVNTGVAAGGAVGAEATIFGYLVPAQ